MVHTVYVLFVCLLVIVLSVHSDVYYYFGGRVALRLGRVLPGVWHGILTSVGNLSAFCFSYSFVCMLCLCLVVVCASFLITCLFSADSSLAVEEALVFSTTASPRDLISVLDSLTSNFNT